MSHPSIVDRERVETYVVSSSTDTFPVEWPVFPKDGDETDVDVDVYVNGALKDSADWSFSGVFANGIAAKGDVVFASPISSGTVRIVGNIPGERTSDFSPGTVKPASLDTELDRLTAMDREGQLRDKRALKIPAYEADSDETPVDQVVADLDDRKGKILGFDPTTGRPKVSTRSLADFDSGTFPANKTADTLTDMKALTPELGDVVLLFGHQSINDGGGGLFYWADSNSDSDDNGFTILPTGHSGAGRWKRLVADTSFRTPLMFGAVADGTTDDTTAVQAAVDHSATGTVFFPAGTYRITSQVTIDDADTLVLRGVGWGSRIKVDFNGIGIGQSTGAAVLTRSAILDLAFEADETTNTAAGGIDIKWTQQGLFFHNLWFQNVPRPIKLLKTFGVTRLSNISARMVGTEVAASVGIRVGDNGGADFSNTVMMSGIDIIGGYAKGLQVEKGSVFSLRDFNISGSGSIEMGTAVEVTSYDQVTIETGWIEKIDEPTATNGEGKALDLTNCPDARLAGILIATGSVYADNCTVNADGIEFSQANGGWGLTNDTRLTTRNVRDGSGGRGAMITSVTGTDFDALWTDEVANDQGAAAVNAEPVVTATSGNTEAAVTNGGLVTLTRETTIWESGGGSLKAVTTATSHGLEFTFTGLKAEADYTFMVRVRRASGGSDTYVQLTQGTSTNLRGRQPQRLRAYDADEWKTLYVSVATAAGVTTAKVKVTADDSSTFYVDSYALLRGTGNFKEPATCAPEPFNKAIPALADDATPSVGGSPSKYWLTGGTTTITDIDDGHEGREITIISEHAVTITDGTNIFLNGSANFVMAATDTLTLVQKADGFWYEVARSVN